MICGIIFCIELMSLSLMSVDAARVSSNEKCLLKVNAIITEKIIIPIPPNCTRIQIIICPINEKVVEISTLASPVIHEADVLIKKASINGTETFGCRENGRLSNNAP